MFTSKNQLINNLGVDPEIAAFFVDRKVPSDNVYWKSRLLYVANGTGYLFIPLFFDFQLKAGIDKQTLLSEEYVGLSESILDSAARYETHEYDFKTHVQNCRSFVAGKTKQQTLYDDLTSYFEQEPLKSYKYLGTPNPALNRGDTFLFQLCILEQPQQVINTIIANWYTLIPSFLLMDDVMDLHEDKQKGEENSIAEFGEGNDAVKKAIEYLRGNFNSMKEDNKKLGDFFEQSLEKKLKSPYLQELLK